RLGPIAEACEISRGRLVVALEPREVGEQMAPIHGGQFLPTRARLACGRPRLVEASEHCQQQAPDQGRTRRRIGGERRAERAQGVVRRPRAPVEGDFEVEQMSWLLTGEPGVS